MIPVLVTVSQSFTSVDADYLEVGCANPLTVGLQVLLECFTPPFQALLIQPWRSGGNSISCQPMGLRLESSYKGGN